MIKSKRCVNKLKLIQSSMGINPVRFYIDLNDDYNSIVVECLINNVFAGFAQVDEPIETLEEAREWWNNEIVTRFAYDDEEMQQTRKLKLLK